jgi:hypothetical protein
LQLDDLVDVVAELPGIKETWVQSLDEKSRDRARGFELVDSHASSENLLGIAAIRQIAATLEMDPVVFRRAIEQACA